MVIKRLSDYRNDETARAWEDTRFFCYGCAVLAFVVGVWHYLT